MIDVRFFRRRQYNQVKKTVVEIAERYRDRLGPQVTDFIEVDCRHGKEEIGTDVVEASWEALFEAYWWGLLKSGVTPLLVE